ncbi:hypothetical protein EDC04DRAFT_2583229, partial [Pisolithus marmoratus]
NNAEDRSTSFHNFALCLLRGSQYQGTVNDLDEAIAVGRAALHFHPPGHPDLNAVLYSLRVRPQEEGAAGDLEEAVTLGRTVLELCPRRHPDRGESLHDLALTFRRSFAEKAVICDSDETIELHRAALEPPPSVHPNRPAFNAL